MYERILVPIDSSPTARRGLREAIALALRLDSTLHLVHAVEVQPQFSDIGPYRPIEEIADKLKVRGETLVAEAVAEAVAAGCRAEGNVRCEVGLGVSDIVLREAADRRVGLIVMGTHGRRGALRLALGSDAEMVVRSSQVPVMLVRKPDSPAAAQD